MSELSAVLKTTYAKELQIVSQELTPRIVPATKMISNVGGDTYRPQVLDRNAGAETAAPTAHGIDLANLAVNHRSPTILLTPRHSPTYLHEYEMETFSASGSIRKDYAINQLANINRWQDDAVVTAMTASNSPLAPAGSASALGQGNFTYNKFITALEMLDNDEYTDYANVVCVVTSKEIMHLRSFIEVKSNDFDTINKISMGKPAELWGVTFIKSDRIQVTAGIIDPSLTTSKCFLFHKSAVVSAFAGSATPKTNITWESAKDQYLINAKVHMGAGVIFPQGVVAIENEDLVL